MKSSRLLTAFGVSLAISAACTLFVGRRFVAGAQASAVTHTYLAANRDLQPGESLRPEILSPLPWSSKEPLSGAFTSFTPLSGRTVLYPIAKGQPVTDRVISSYGAGAGLAARIPPGMRAIALKSDEIVGVAGFLMPGERVDVLVSYRGQANIEPVTVTVLQNAEVLASGQKTEPDPDGKPVTSTVVTLLLTPADAQRAVLASTQGAIHFVLRSGSDQQVETMSPVFLRSLAGGTDSVPAATPEPRRVAAAAPRPAHPALPASHAFVMETIAGDKLSTTRFETEQP